LVAILSFCIVLCQRDVDGLLWSTGPAFVNRSAQHAWSGAAYEVYRTQLTHIFKIFNELQIHPRDINTCCNLITNGPEVKVIDFGLYFIEKNQSKLQQSNAHLLDKLLVEIARSVEKHAHRS